MKKRIFSLMLAVIMLVFAIPVAYAATLIPCPNACVNSGGSEIYLANCPNCGAQWTQCYQCNTCTECSPAIPAVGKTTVTLVGTEETYYEVSVPAEMIPGKSATVSVTGTWGSNQTLKVSAPEKVTLYNGNQSMDIEVNFEAISQSGSDVEESTASTTLSIENVTVKFGTWVGVIEYNVELVESSVGGSEESNLINFEVTQNEIYQAQEGMTFAEWVNSEYNTDGYYIDGDKVMLANGTHKIASMATPNTVITAGKIYGVIRADGSGGAAA